MKGEKKMVTGFKKRNFFLQKSFKWHACYFHLVLKLFSATSTKLWASLIKK